MLLGHRVTSLLGTGTPADPVRGVMLDDGRALSARWVRRCRRAAVHGRRPTRCRARPGAPRRRRDAAGVLARPALVGLDLPRHAGGQRLDGHAVRGRHPPADRRRRPVVHPGTRAPSVEKRYHEVLPHLPQRACNPRLLDRAQLIGPVLGCARDHDAGLLPPSPRVRAGPWSATPCHFKHPTTGQGIGDALAQATLRRRRPRRAGATSTGYETWRAEPVRRRPTTSRSGWRRLPAAGDESARYAGLAADHDGRPGRSSTPSPGEPGSRDVFTAGACRAAGAPPPRTRTDTAASLLFSRSSAGRRSPRGFPRARTGRSVTWSPTSRAWRTTRPTAPTSRTRSTRGSQHDLAAAREEWTAAHVTARDAVDPSPPTRRPPAARPGLRAGPPQRWCTVACGVPAWQVHSPPADLAVHLEDLHEALGVPSAPDAVVTLSGVLRLPRAGWAHGSRHPAFLPSASPTAPPSGSWAGNGAPGASLVGSRRELFRAISGRRSLDPDPRDGRRGRPDAVPPRVVTLPAAFLRLLPTPGLLRGGPRPYR